MVPENPPKTTRIKASLRRLAGPGERTLIEHASESTDDIEAAARFVDRYGLDQLAAAVSSTDDPELRARGRRTLTAFRRFRRAAAGGDTSTDDHFHHGHGTHLRADGERPPQ